jgi:hypothetical protein
MADYDEEGHRYKPVKRGRGRYYEKYAMVGNAITGGSGEPIYVPKKKKFTAAPVGHAASNLGSLFGIASKGADLALGAAFAPRETYRAAKLGLEKDIEKEKHYLKYESPLRHAYKLAIKRKQEREDARGGTYSAPAGQEEQRKIRQEARAKQGVLKEAQNWKGDKKNIWVANEMDEARREIANDEARKKLIEYEQKVGLPPVTDRWNKGISMAAKQNIKSYPDIEEYNRKAKDAKSKVTMTKEEVLRAIEKRDKGIRVEDAELMKMKTVRDFRSITYNPSKMKSEDVLGNLAKQETNFLARNIKKKQAEGKYNYRMAGLYAQMQKGSMAGIVTRGVMDYFNKEGNANPQKIKTNYGSFKDQNIKTKYPPNQNIKTSYTIPKSAEAGATPTLYNTYPRGEGGANQTYNRLVRAQKKQAGLKTYSMEPNTSQNIKTFYKTNSNLKDRLPNERFENIIKEPKIKLTTQNVKTFYNTPPYAKKGSISQPAYLPWGKDGGLNQNIQRATRSEMKGRGMIVPNKPRSVIGVKLSGSFANLGKKKPVASPTMTIKMPKISVGKTSGRSKEDEQMYDNFIEKIIPELKGEKPKKLSKSEMQRAKNDYETHMDNLSMSMNKPPIIIGSGIGKNIRTPKESPFPNRKTHVIKTPKISLPKTTSTKSIKLPAHLEQYMSKGDREKYIAARQVKGTAAHADKMKEEQIARRKEKKKKKGGK